MPDRGRRSACPSPVVAALAAALGSLTPAPAALATPGNWSFNPRQRPASPVAVAFYGDMGTLLYDDLPHTGFGGGLSVLGRPPGPKPVFHAGAYLVYPGDVASVRLEVGGGVWNAHRDDFLGGLEGVFTLGIRESAVFKGAALRPWIGAQVDMRDHCVMIGVHFTLGFTDVAEDDLSGRYAGPWLAEGKAWVMGVGFRIAGPWPARLADGVP